MPLRDLVRIDGLPLSGRLIYSVAEYSFRFDVTDHAELNRRSGYGGRSSLEIETLQVEVDAACGTVLFVWGYHPYHRWERDRCAPNRLVPGLVRARVVPGFLAGAAVGVAAVGEWCTVWDPMSGWVRVAPPGRVRDEVQVLVASQTVLGITRGGLSSVWLHPEFEFGVRPEPNG